MDTPEIFLIEKFPTDWTLSFLIFPEGLLFLLQYWGTFHSQIHSILEIVFPVWAVGIGVFPELDVTDDFHTTRRVFCGTVVRSIVDRLSALYNQILAWKSGARGGFGYTGF